MKGRGGEGRGGENGGKKGGMKGRVSAGLVLRIARSLRGEHPQHHFGTSGALAFEHAAMGVRCVIARLVELDTKVPSASAAYVMGAMQSGQSNSPVHRRHHQFHLFSSHNHSLADNDIIITPMPSVVTTAAAKRPIGVMHVWSVLLGMMMRGGGGSIHVTDLCGQSGGKLGHVEGVLAWGAQSGGGPQQRPHANAVPGPPHPRRELHRGAPLADAVAAIAAASSSSAPADLLREAADLEERRPPHGDRLVPCCGAAVVEAPRGRLGPAGTPHTHATLELQPFRRSSGG